MKKALIFRGGWEGHEPIQVSEIFSKLLNKEDIATEIYDNLDCLADPEKLKTYDLIVPVWTMGEISNDYANNVCKAVENGTAIAGCHGGMCDAFRNNTGWQFLTGSQWVAHPGNENIEYTVEILPNDEILSGIPDFSLKSEQYYIHVDPAVKIHAVTKFVVQTGPHMANGEVTVPVVYTKMWGKGKVFYSSLGHNAAIFDIPEALEIMRRGFVWATRKDK